MLLPYSTDHMGALVVDDNILYIRPLDRATLSDAIESILLEENGTVADNDVVDFQPLTDDRSSVGGYYKQLKAKQLGQLNQERFQLYVDNNHALPNRMLYRLILAMAAVCCDWDVECNAADNMRPPRLTLRLNPVFASDIDLVQCILFQGPEETNISQLLALGDLYAGQMTGV